MTGRRGEALDEPIAIRLRLAAMHPVTLARRHLGPLAAVLVASLAILVPACGGLGSQCADYCDRYRECVDGTVVVATCEKSCRDWADGHSDRESKVDKCSECVAQNDVCSDATRRCFADCVGVPVR